MLGGGDRHSDQMTIVIGSHSGHIIGKHPMASMHPVLCWERTQHRKVFTVPMCGHFTLKSTCREAVYLCQVGGKRLNFLEMELLSIVLNKVDYLPSNNVCSWESSSEISSAVPPLFLPNSSFTKMNIHVITFFLYYGNFELISLLPYNIIVLCITPTESYAGRTFNSK